MDFYYKGILCEIEGTKIERRVTRYNQVLLLFDFYISLPSSLSFGARSNSLPASTSWYLVLHSSLARGWAAGQSARDQQINQLGLHLTPRILLNPTSCLQRYNTFQRLLSQKSFQNPTKQKTLVLKTEIRRVESQRKTCAAKSPLHSCKIEGLTGTGEAFVLDLTSQL